MANTINQPDGSSASPLNPPAPAAASASSWTERYTVDFSAQSAHDFSSGSVALDGVEWTVGNDAQATAVEIVNGSGLELSPSTSTDLRWYTAGTINAPRVAATIQSGSNPLYSSLGITQAFAFQAIIEPGTELGANYDEWGILLTNAATTYYATSCRQFDSATFSGGSPTIGNYLLRSVNTARGAVVGSAEAATHKFFELVYYPGGTVVASSSAASDFVEPLSATTFQKFVTTSPGTTSTGSSVPFKNTDMYAAFYIANYGSSTAFKAVVKKCRILTLD